MYSNVFHIYASCKIIVKNVWKDDVKYKAKNGDRNKWKLKSKLGVYNLPLWILDS